MNPVFESTTDFTPYIRDLTDAEVRFFRENGWVFAPRFIDPELAEEVRQHYKAWSGIRWDTWPESEAEQKEFIEIVKDKFTDPRKTMAIRQDDPWMFTFVTQRKLGEATARLLNVESVKPYSETLQVKYPASSGFSRELPWHQDLPSMSIDRADAAQTWIALAPATADMGTMRHLSGSHREPPRGMTHFSGEDPAIDFPDIWEKYQIEPPRDYAAGDALFHHCLTFHCSGQNQTNKIRWAMSSLRFSGRSIYTGQQNTNTDGLGLQVNKFFDHPNFPTVYP